MNRARVFVVSLSLLVVTSCTPAVVKLVSDTTLPVDMRRERCSILDARGYLAPLEARQRCADNELRGAQLAHRARLTDMALYRYQRALLYLPDLAPAHNSIGEILMERGRTDIACGAFAQAMRIDPAYASAKRNRTSCLLEQGDVYAAQMLLDQCDGPGDLQCHCAKGMEALNAYDIDLPDGLEPETLLNWCPQMPTAEVDRCRERLAAGDCSNAERACHAALTAWPDNRTAKKGWRAAQSCLIAQKLEGAGGSRALTAMAEGAQQR